MIDAACRAVYARQAETARVAGGGYDLHVQYRGIKRRTIPLELAAPA
jgi:hypothetical protein